MKHNRYTNKALLLAAGLTVFAASCKKDDNPTTTTTNSGATASIGNVISVPVTGRYIFTINLTPGGADYASRQADLLRLVNSKMGALNLPLLSQTDVFTDALVGFVANVSEEQARRIAQDAMVVRYEQDQTIGYQPFNILFPNPTPGSGTTQTEEYGVRRTGRGDGTGKRAWIIDTGLDLDHEDLTVDVNRSRSFVAGTFSADDDNGHGTHVGGIVGAKNNSVGVIGVAAGATLIAVKVLASNGSGRVSDVISGVDYVAGNATAGDAANISIGGGVSTALDAATVGLASRGIFTAVAAGNSSTSVSTSSPGRANGTNLYTVSAMDASDNFASFSNFGPGVDYADPGVNVRSTYPGNMYRVLSGTSMASPHLCGVLLLTGGAPKSGGTVRGDKDATPDPIGVR